jgi:hypothetical protein
VETVSRERLASGTPLEIAVDKATTLREKAKIKAAVVIVMVFLVVI